ncbi:MULTISPECIES: hypothetical protein [unclassified Streptomyces]|uniref:hypothetical protein n=1 Tax=unclassified Streptomyces TaxID=2593676 RepID=UPI0036304E45
MDAGLAAVLGATVGAIGTGATGVAAALLGRSSTRHQIRAEALRALRESRRATYLSFAETHERYLDLLSTTLVPINKIQRFPDDREELTEKAHKHWVKALRCRQSEVQKVRVVLYLDATPSVAEAALEVTKRFTLLSHATGSAIEALKGQALDTGPRKPPLPGYAELLREDGFDPEAPDLERMQKQARDAYRAFLRIAADSIGENGILHPG